MVERKTRIAFFAEILLEDFDGASRTIFQLIHRIPKESFEFLFICGVGPKEGFPYEVLEIPAMTIPFNKNYKMAIPYFHKAKINDKLASFQPDVIHISTPSPLGTYGLEYANERNIPVISIYHTHFVSYIDYYFENIKFLIDPIKSVIICKLKKFYEACSLVYVPTQIMVDELSSYGIENDNMKLWPRGLNLDTFTPTKRNKDYIQQLTGNAHPNILFASRLVWEKNLRTLIRIYKKAKKKGLNYNFILAGDGLAYEELKESMPDAIFTGKMKHSELSHLYASADIFLFTSVTETYGNVVAEAIASGLPCVIANGGGSAGFIEDGVNGFLCEPESSKDYLQKIDTILSNDALRSQFIDKGVAFSQTLKWESLTDTYFTDLKQLSDTKNQVIAVV